MNLTPNTLRFHLPCSTSFHSFTGNVHKVRDWQSEELNEGTVLIPGCEGVAEVPALLDNLGSTGVLNSTEWKNSVTSSGVSFFAAALI